MIVRLCNDDEGYRIEEFLRGKKTLGSRNHGVSVRWDIPLLTWLLAEQDNKIVGVVMLAICPPIGIFENMVLDQDYPEMARARAVAMLIETGYRILRGLGCSAACCFIPDENIEFRELLQKRGHRVAYRGEMLIRQL